MEKSKIVILGLLIFGFWFASGCATMFNDNPESVNIYTNPEGADVFVDGKQVGKSPVNVKLSITENHSIIVANKGYKSKLVKIERKVGAGWGFCDLLLFPVLGMLAGGVIVVLALVASQGNYFNREGFSAIGGGGLAGGVIFLLGGLIIDAASGNWSELKVKNGLIRIDLEPVKKSKKPKAKTSKLKSKSSQTKSKSSEPKDEKK